MEDAATAEISRAQLWQWIHHKAKFSDGRTVTLDLVLKLMGSMKSWRKVRQAVGDAQSEPAGITMRQEFCADLVSQAVRWIS